MDLQGDREVFVFDSSVIPGYLYNTVTNEYTSKDVKNIKTEDQPITYRFDTWSKERMNALQKNEIYRTDKWVKHYRRENAVDCVMVKGEKILEKRGIDVRLDTEAHTVTSVFYKCHVNLLMIFSQAVPKEALKKLCEYLSCVTHSSKESFLPQVIEKSFKIGYLYQSLSDEGTGLTPVKYCLHEFCRILTESRISSHPIRACIKAPFQLDEFRSHVKSVHTLIEFFESNENDISGSKKLGSSKEEVPQVHSTESRNAIVGLKEDCLSSKKEMAHAPVQQMSKHDALNPVNTYTEQGRETKGITDGGESKCYKLESQAMISNRNGSCVGGGSVAGSGHSQKEIENLQSSTGIPCTSNVSKDESRIEKTEKVQTTYQLSYCSIDFRVRNDDDAKVTVTNEKMQSSSYVAGQRRDSDEQGKNITGAAKSQSTSEIMNSISTEDIESKAVNKKVGNCHMGCEAIVFGQNVKEGKPSDDSVVNDKSEDLECDEKHVNRRSDEALKEKEKSSECIAKKEQVKKPKHVGHDFPIKTEKEEKNINSVKELEKVSISNERMKQGRNEGVEDNEKGFEKENKRDVADESQIKQLGNQKTARDSSVHAQKRKDTSARISGNQKQLCQGLAVGDVRDPPALKATHKEKCGKEKRKVLKSKLLTPKNTLKDACGIERKFYCSVDSNLPEKVILLLGASGSGKTMLINFIANYFAEKKKADDDLVHVENTSPTSAITAYTFCHSADDIPITIIDTPGLNDSSGAEVRDHVQSLKTFLANASSNDFKIHAIGFVAQAYLVRLTSSERLVMDYVSKMFGHSISEHLISLVTFADNQDSPPVVEAMKNYGVNCKIFLKFNNSALSNTKSDEIDDLDRAYWRICWRNWKKCLKTLKDLSPLSVNTMRTVQNEIYAATVIKSAEKDLSAELVTFFSHCKNKSLGSKEVWEVCEKVWELAIIVHRLRRSTDSRGQKVDDLLIEFAVESCKVHRISPEKYLGFLSLSPSRALVVGGQEIICAMMPIFQIARENFSDSESMSKSIIEWSHCHVCDREHKMTKLKSNGMKEWFSGSNGELVTLKCQDCKCPGEVHGVSSVKSPFHMGIVIKLTKDRLNNVCSRYSFSKYPVPEGTFLNCVAQYCNAEQKAFLKALCK